MASEQTTVQQELVVARGAISAALRLLVEQGGNLSLRDELHRVAVRLDLLLEAMSLGGQAARQEDADV